MTQEPNQDSATQQSRFKYWAFISYSHRDNRKDRNLWGDWLHDAVENFKVPTEMAGKMGRRDEPVPGRLFPTFQDEKELPTNADLGTAIQEALEQSRYLVVICSPRSAKSIYVNQEILEFKRLGRANRILAIIIDGEPNASEPGKGYDLALECFPEALRHPLDSDGKLDLTRNAEPIAADVRDADGKEASLKEKTHQPTLEREKLRVMAGLLGVGFDDLVHRDKERQLREERARAGKFRRLAAAFGVLAVAAMVAGIVAVKQRREADRQRLEADRQKHLVLSGVAADEEADGRSSLFQGDAAGALIHFSKAYQVNTNEPALRFMIRFAMEKYGQLAGQKTFNASVTSAEFSPDGKQVLSTDGRDEAEIWQSVGGTSVCTLSDPEGYIEDGQFTSDGRYAVTACEYPGNRRDCAGCKIWNAKTGSLVMRIKTQAPVRVVVIAPDDRKIAAVNVNNAIEVFARDTGDEICSLNNFINPRTEGIVDLKFSPDSKSCLAYTGRSVKLISLADGTEMVSLSLTNHDSTFSSASFNAAGSEIIVTDGKTASILSSQDGTSLKRLVEPDNMGVVSAEFSPDNSMVLVGRLDGTASFWDLRETRRSATLPCTGGLVSLVRFSHDGKMDVTVNVNDIRTWDVPSGRLRDCFNLHQLMVKFASFSRDDHYLLTAGDDKVAMVWDATVKDAPLTISHDYFFSVIDDPVISPDGTKILVSTPNIDKNASVYGTEGIYDLSSGLKTVDLPVKTPSQNCAKFSRDGQSVVIGDGNGIVTLASVKTGETLQQFRDTNEFLPGITSVDVSEDGHFLAAGDQRGTVQLYDLKGQAQTPLLKLETSGSDSNWVPIGQVRFNPQGTEVLGLSNPNSDQSAINTVYVWNLASPNSPVKISDHSKAIVTARFSLDGNLVLTASLDKTAKIWNAKDGALIRVLNGHVDGLTSAQFSPDGTLIVTTSNDGTAKLWKTSDGKLIADLNAGGSAAVQAAAFSPNGQFLATVPGDGFVIVWDTMTGNPLALYKDYRRSWAGVAFSPNGKQLVAMDNRGSLFCWNLGLSSITPKELNDFVKNIPE